MDDATSIHSRTVLAGYSPDVMHEGRVAIIGAGALGQNCAVNLALSGVGRIAVVDLDRFEAHNATRSPCYPTEAEVARVGWGKAPVVASRLRAIATAPAPEVFYSTEPVQRLGDGVIRWADVVVSAVDNLAARAWLAERCRLHGRPMIEGGFSGSRMSFSAFGPGAEEPCYRCTNPDRESSASCTQYAHQAESAQVIPAIQVSAAALGAYTASLAISVLHGDTGSYGARFYGDARVPKLARATLQRDPNCPNFRHAPIPDGPEVRLRDDAGATVGDVARLLHGAAGVRRLRFAEPVLLSVNCTRCPRLCAVRSLESAWLAVSRCRPCGGPWVAEAGASSPDARVDLRTDELDGRLAAIPAADLGLRPGGAVEVELADGRSGVVRFAGNPLDLMHEAGLPGLDRIAVGLSGA